MKRIETEILSKKSKKEIQEELDIKTKELEQSNAELEQFAYIASHDLQEPLRIMTNYIGLLKKRYKDKLDKDANEYINLAIDAGNRMRTLIQSLLEYTRVNRIKPFEWIDTNETISIILEDINTSIKENNIIIRIDKLPEIYGDSVLINVLFQHLIENAIKFRRTKNPEIIISCKKENNEFLFSVKDNGIGINKKHSDSIFLIFQQLNSKEEFSGAGIGLPICKKIVERHGGKIWVESKLDEGSTFYFTISKKLKAPPDLPQGKED